MNIELYIIISLLFLVIILLISKIYIMKRSIREIELLLTNILSRDTNSLITISSSDRNIQKLAITLNNELANLRNQKLKYQNGNQELKRLVTNISHDLRTPLTAIKGYVELLNEEENKKKQENYLNIIDNKSNELVELTNQLFDFSKTIDVGIRKEVFCINEILEETLISYYNVFREKQIEPKILICKQKIYKNINKDSIIRVFENILSNIVKYSNNSFFVELKDDGKVTFLNKSNSLDATTVQKIFDRYFTVENAKQSIGIGLSIAKELVELNGGNIDAKYINGDLIIEIELH